MLETLSSTLLTVPVLPELCPTLSRELSQQINNKTKPRKSLGFLEALACQIGLIQNTHTPQLNKVIATVFAADHGIATAGVSAFPQAVTKQMIQNFLSGNAAINVLCRANHLDLQVVDCGVIGGRASSMRDESGNRGTSLTSSHIADGTASFVDGNAVSEEQLLSCWRNGASIAKQLLGNNYAAVAFGEMGIGNTSSAALLTHYLTGIALDHCIGRGTGLDGQALNHKKNLLIAIASNATITSIDQLLRRFGGFEIITMASTMLHYAAGRGVVIVDGFISTAAFLIANSLCPALKEFSIFSHCSAEQAHSRVIEHLHVHPLLKLDMRLGEASGAALAVPLLRSAVAILNEMATFSAAEVSEEIMANNLA